MLTVVFERAAVHSRRVLGRAAVLRNAPTCALSAQAILNRNVSTMYASTRLGRSIQGQPFLTSDAARQIRLAHITPTHSWSCHNAQSRRITPFRSTAACAAFHRPADLLLYGLPGANQRLLSTTSPTATQAAAGLVAEQQQQQDVVLQRIPLPGDLEAMREKLQFYNTMSRQKEHFKPRQELDGKVQMYVCGVTVYDYSHIGHARVYVAFDILYRLLQQLGYDVQYVRNFTDIDDKIINRAHETGEEPLALSARFIEEFNVDMKELGCLAPTFEPKATAFIPQMIATIEAIIKNGHGYALEDGNVYFDVASLPGYGRLSGRSQEDNRAGERVAVDGRKRHPADFALWKAGKAGEPSWASPWGPGRPGWHIECSSMIRSVMGPVIDIHGGGRDLVFPHHENELAQSQAACSCCDKPQLHNSTDFVRYWLHNGFVNVDSEKMSKSLGNFFTIRDVLALYHPMALRWFLVSSQYRAPINYTQRALDEASDRVYYVYQTLAEIQTLLESSGDAGAAAVAAAGEELAGGQGPAAELLQCVVDPLLDDLNTPVAVSALSAPLKAANDLMSTKAGRKNPKRLPLLASYNLGLLAVADLLGVGVGDVQGALQQLRERALARADVTAEEVEARITARAEARKAKDFAAADAVRKEMEAVGIYIMDTPQGTTWRPGLPTNREEADATAAAGAAASK